VCIIGICTAAMISLAGSALVYLLYVGSCMTALTYVSFASPLPGLERVFQVTQIVYFVALVAIMRSVHRSLRDNLLLRLKLAASLDELRETQSKLMDASREAGRNEVAANILHNVGNVLTSVFVSAKKSTELVCRSRTATLPKVVAMLDENREDLGRFFAEDPRGAKLLDYFPRLVEAIEKDRCEVSSELGSMMKNLDHVEAILGSQQRHLSSKKVVEPHDVGALVDDALAIGAAAFANDGIAVEREVDAMPKVPLDRHKVLEILVNLLANAREALEPRPAGERRVTVRATRGAKELEIAIEDTGCGIEPGDLDRIFNLGYTTKTGARGFGLHYSACAARELGGRLTASSDGPGRGATFRIALPAA
jgi:signal transduction histidine kinase